MGQYRHFQGFVITLLDELPFEIGVEAADFLDEREENATAVGEMLRRRVTPVGVQQRIMASLPDTPGTATNWWKQITPVSAIAITVALLAVGALIIQALR